ncbi:hypothetical protein Cni_G14465 [Canna indica]|uniref:Uncharacterized protein n=1 Tax=Canna indica TaxID=4628 RepID=A0AAQ3KCZ5_9LILI|nr:hypothetical protein Cni_G14465 [Canna indica]
METDEPSPRRIEWSRKYCHKMFEYSSCEFLGLLEFDPLEEKPTLAVGLTVMITLSVPVPALVVMLHFMDAAKEILQRLHIDGE